MPKRALRCVVNLKIHAVSAPGVWLPSKEQVYLSVYMLGQYRSTHLMSSIFPLLVDEKFKFEKTFYTAMDPSDVADYMEDELVVFELVQLSEYTDGGVRLATFSTNLRDFLYPYPSLAPTYTSTSREMLLSRTVAFPGIAPKLEFSTSTVIKESYSPELDALDEALEEERRLRRLRLKHVCSPKRGRSASLSKRFEDIDLTDSITRPPFVVRKLDKDLIGRIPGGPAEKNARMKKRRSYSLSRSPSRTSLANFCEYVAKSPDKSCMVCEAYERHMGRPYWGHGRNFHPTGLYCEECWVYRDPYDDPLPVYRSKYLLDDDDDDAEVAELTSQRRRNDIMPVRPRSVSPFLYRSSYSSRFNRPSSPYTSYSPSTSSLTKHRSMERLDRLSPVDVTPFLPRRSPYSYTRDSLDDLERETVLARSRSEVHINNDKYWTEDAAQLSGKSHRMVFIDNLSQIYSNLYDSASSSS
ncbi:spermatogenesis-associated protein 6-like isoform X3 [Gigantopelta aegis]|uniref:spermatogenesis-associated protein 6-like isoform X3 n=1 Tax=Gigantopelta aegis TaxID=1735272 RepID=UPI001B887CC5|nr:spermatogenesis-associated protein 6-like isoform X3 [Gigantopelta aegis]